MSYQKQMEVIQKPWSGVAEIMLLANCGRDTATKIRNKVSALLIKNGYILPTGKTIQVPTRELLNFLGLDAEYIINMANKLNTGDTYGSLSK